MQHTHVEISLSSFVSSVMEQKERESNKSTEIYLYGYANILALQVVYKIWELRCHAQTQFYLHAKLTTPLCLRLLDKHNKNTASHYNCES